MASKKRIKRIKRIKLFLLTLLIVNSLAGMVFGIFWSKTAMTYFGGDDMTSNDDDYNPWWTWFVVVVSAVINVVLCRAWYLVKKGRRCGDDLFFQSGVVMIVLFAMMSVFSVAGYFTDENDNIRGGMIIARGGELYKDYVTQHPPLMYYLCAIFALCGAGSLAQFRIMYYGLLALVWMLIFIRYGKSLGKKRIFLFGVMCTVFLPYLVESTRLVELPGARILSDSVQGLCIVTLLLEFLMYCRDERHSLDWKRSVIVSLCIWCSFGSAFTSVYALMAFSMAFLVVEISYWRKNRLSFKDAFGRYWKILVAIFAPLIVFLAYFCIVGAIDEAIRQMFFLNTEVYVNYSGYGHNIFQPMLDGVWYTIKIFGEVFYSISTLKITRAVVFRAIVLVLFFVTLVMTLRKVIIEKCVEWVVALAVIIVMLSATRSYGFHGMAAWEAMMFVGAIFYQKPANKILRRCEMSMWILMACVASIPYAKNINALLHYEMIEISETEKYIIENTSEGDYIGLNAWNSESLYYTYKNREIANRVVYMLPWYMEWYDEGTVKDFSEKQPEYIIMNPEAEVWGYKDFAKETVEYLKETYERVGGEIVWKRISVD